MELTTENYLQQCSRWPQTGQHILAQYDDVSIVVYQAFKPSIAEYAVRHQKFGGDQYKVGRMTWIKTNFLWMMYRSGWASKPNQERILAISLTVDGFEEILKNAFTTDFEKKSNLSRDAVCVRLQWDPDHDPLGLKVSRRAIQLGLKGEVAKSFNEKYILKICDITDFVQSQYKHVTSDNIQELITPKECVFTPRDQAISQRIGLS